MRVETLIHLVQEIKEKCQLNAIIRELSETKSVLTQNENTSPHHANLELKMEPKGQYKRCLGEEAVIVHSAGKNKIN